MTRPCTAPGCTHPVKGHGIHHQDDAGNTWTDYRPTSGKAEIHPLLACDLDCAGCNRASFLRKPHTKAMTLDDLREFFRQADVLDFHPFLTIVGGEPTLHPDYTQIVKECVAWAGAGRVQVWSNAYRPKARELLQISRKQGASVCNETQKLEGAIRSDGANEPEWWTSDIYVSPKDYGLKREACWNHASVICGISVDAEGYSPCGMGNTIAALLDVPCRTNVLADLFDEKKVAEMTEAMCEHCGMQYMGREGRADLDSLPKLFDTPCSPTWYEALKDRR